MRGGGRWRCRGTFTIPNHELRTATALRRAGEGLVVLTIDCLGYRMHFMMPSGTVGFEMLVPRELTVLGTDNRSSSQLPWTAVIGCRACNHVREQLSAECWLHSLLVVDIPSLVRACKSTPSYPVISGVRWFVT